MHEPVLKDEALHYLNVKKDFKVIDSTLGYGGHTLFFLENGAKVLSIEADQSMIDLASERLKKYIGNELTIVHGNFRNIDKIAKDNDFSDADAILADLGISSVHLDSSKRGFSFKDESQTLDMRLDVGSQSVTASDLLNALREDQLRRMFGDVMGGLAVTHLAREVVSKRIVKKFETVGDFLEVVRKVMGRHGHLNEATLPFLALRIAVNIEIDSLKEYIPNAFSVLKSSGRLGIISFHSLEDQVVKHKFVEFVKSGEGILIDDIIVPKDDEITKNPRSRSAKFRVIEKK